MRRLLGIAAAIAIASGSANAQQQPKPDDREPKPDDRAPKPEHEHEHEHGDGGEGESERLAPKSAAEVRDAPDPTAASGRAETDGGDGFGRKLGRGILWVPRGLVYAVFAPVRGGLWAADRYQIGERLGRIFAGGGPVQVFPAAALESGFGITYGVGATYSDVFGHDEKITGRFLFGGEVKQIYSIGFHFGELLGKDTRVDLRVDAELLKGTRFWGLGSGELVDDLDVMPPLDATAGAQTVETRFDQDVLRAGIAAEHQFLPWLRAGANSTLMFRSFDRSSVNDSPSTEDIFDPSTTIGYENGASLVYTEIEAQLDTRRTTNPYFNTELPATGWNLTGFTGYALGVGNDPSKYLHYGADVQRYFDLYDGTRVLILRGGFEGVTADVDRIDFSDLPQLGGSRELRGYPRGRFRDRYMTLTSAEYRYPVSGFIASYLFAEAGGVWRRLRDIDPGELRYSVGGGVMLLTKNHFIARLQVGIGDEALNLSLSFNPAVQLRPRVRR